MTLAKKPIDLKRLGVIVKRFAKSNESYRLLDRHEAIRGTSWASGGCSVLAHALLRICAGLSLVGVVDASGVIHHVLVHKDGVFIDADGPSTSKKLLHRWKHTEMLTDPRIVWDLPDHAPGIVCPAKAVAEVAEALRSALETS